jgi:hypothetical protein
MSIKSQNVKKFITDTGTSKQLFVFVGADTKNTTSDSSQTEIDIWNDSDFSLRVGQNSLSAVVQNIKWVQKNAYVPWSATTQNVGNFYAYNEQNGYVYLCVSDNAKNTINQNKNISNIRPSHITGIQSYSDGYSWLTLYRITASHERFISSQWIPVFSFDTFDASDQQTQLQKTQSFCNSNTGETGQCGIYAKIPLSTDDDDGTIEYQKGNLFTVAQNITCSDCHYLMYNDEKFVSKFYSNSTTVPSTITINGTYEEVGNLIQLNQISTASPYYYLYNINETNNLDEGCIISAFVDLTGLSNTQLITNTLNPSITIVSNTGSGASLRFTTSIYNDSYVVDGIEVISRGSNYKDYRLSVNNNNFLGISGDTLLNKIRLNLDKIDHIGVDPISVLGSQHVMIDARIEKQNIVNSGIGLPTNVNFFGLVENPLGISGSTQVISGSNINKKLDSIFRTTIKAAASVVGSPSLLPETDEKYDTSPSVGDEDPLTDVIIGGVSDVVGGSPSTSTIEIKNVPYSKSASLVGSELIGPIGESPKVGTVINTIVEVPSFVQYTGNILSTTKLSSNLPVSDVDSVIIRINMVRGM